MQQAIEEAVAEFNESLAPLSDSVQELVDIQAEYQEWEENLPESFQNGNSPVSEKLQEVINLEIESYADLDEVEVPEVEVDFLDEVENMAGEAEAIDLPLGFGRD